MGSHKTFLPGLKKVVQLTPMKLVGSVMFHSLYTVAIWVE